jgi:hypothetical protein
LIFTLVSNSKNKKQKITSSGKIRIKTTGGKPMSYKDYITTVYVIIENIKAVSLEGFLTKIHFFILAFQFKIILNV